MKMVCTSMDYCDTVSVCLWHAFRKLILTVTMSINIPVFVNEISLLSSFIVRGSVVCHTKYVKAGKKFSLNASSNRMRVENITLM